MATVHVFSNFFVIQNFWSFLSYPMICHQVRESLQNKASISNVKNAEIYSCNIYRWHNCYRFEDRLLTVVETINLFQKLDFVIHPDKSKFIPAKIVEYLSFANDSEKLPTYQSDQKTKKFMANVASFQRNQNWQ